jgi:acetolactate synthase-1/2/3 large subunit
MNHTVASRIVDYLISQKVDTVFGVPGEQLDPIFEALFEKRKEIRLITARHEQGAAYMAYGYARSTGKVGVFIVPPGPGFLNSTAGLSTAYAGNTPVLCITGQIPSQYIGSGYGLLHEIPDQLGVASLLSKWSTRISSASEVDSGLIQALSEVNNGRPRPVVVEIPPDVLTQPVTESPLPEIPLTPKPSLDETLVEKAVSLLQSAHSPLIMIGGGATDAGETIVSIAEKVDAAVVANCSGRGIVSDRHPRCVTWPAGNKLWAEADVVLAVGTKLFQPLVAWGHDEHLDIIRIDIDPAEINRIKTPTVGLVGDAHDLLSIIDSRLKDNKSSKRLAVITETKETCRDEYSRLQSQTDYLGAIRSALPEDGIFVDELTQIGYVARFAFEAYSPRTFIPPSYQGTLGFGFAAAIGAKAGNPGRAVISINGDGGIAYNISELATVVQEEIPVVIVVFNDQAFGNVLRAQQKKGFCYGTKLHNPDFVALAQSYGAKGVRVNNAQELEEEIKLGIRRSGPTLIEVPVEQMPNPWEFIRLPKVRGNE